MPSTLLEQQDFFRTELNQEVVDSTDIIIYLKTLPTKEKGYLIIEQDDTSKREIIYYTSLGSGCVVLDDVSGRGIGGTTAQSHADDSDVVMDDVAEYHNPITTLLSNYRGGCGLSVTGETDNISALAGNIVINGAVCINSTSETLTDIGASGTNKSGNVASGGYRYIYAQDVGDGTWELYVSNNTTETGKRRLGLAKFKEGSTTLIRYVYDDDDYSPLARGIVLEWNGPLTDIPIGYALCNGVTAGTPDCSDKFVITAGATYAFGATGGAATVALSIANLAAHDHGSYTGYYDVNHYHVFSGTTGGQSVTHTHQYCGQENTKSDNNGSTGNWNWTVPAYGTMRTDLSYLGNATNDHGHNYGGNTGWQTGGTVNHRHSIASQGSGTAHNNMPPYIALVRIMRL